MRHVQRALLHVFICSRPQESKAQPANACNCAPSSNNTFMPPSTSPIVEARHKRHPYLVSAEHRLGLFLDLPPFCVYTSNLLRTNSNFSSFWGRDRPATSETAMLRRAEVKSEVNYLSLLTKGDACRNERILEVPVLRVWNSICMATVDPKWYKTCAVHFDLFFLRGLGWVSLCIRFLPQTHYSWIDTACPKNPLPVCRYSSI